MIKKADNLWKKAHGRRSIPAAHVETVHVLLRVWHTQADKECRRLRAKLEKGMLELHGEAYARWVAIRSFLEQQLSMGTKSVADADYLAATVEWFGTQPHLDSLTIQG